MIVALAIALSILSPETLPTPPPRSPPVEWACGAAAGLMSGVVVMHAVQPIAALTGALPWKDKFWISAAGALLYSADLVGLLLRQRWALWGAIVVPVVGLTAVLGGWALSRAGVVDWTVSPDAFQVVGGLLQVGAAVLSVELLRWRTP